MRALCHTDRCAAPAETGGVRRRVASLGLAIATIAAFAGCAAPLRSAGFDNRQYRPNNVCAAARVLPATVKRVVVLPLACDSRPADLADGCDALDPVLRSELVRTKRFEVVPICADDLRRFTGSGTWDGAEALPPDFFDWLRDTYDCDAVLFCRLTEFHAYPPLAVGWRMKLVDVRSQRILWAADEQFDAGQPPVLNSATCFALDGQVSEGRASDEWLVRNSPRRFGQYAAAQLLATLPKR